MRRWYLGGLGGGVFGVHCRCCGVGIAVEMWVLGDGLEHGGLDEWVEFRGGGAEWVVAGVVVGGGNPRIHTCL
jgi:hypothetical protein